MEEQENKVSSEEKENKNVEADELKADSAKKAEQSSEPLEDQEGSKEEKSPLEKTQEELNEWKKKAAYLAAELENMGKRFQREKSEIIRFANDDMLKKILPVMDNLSLALKAGKETEKADEKSHEKSLKSMLQGVEMTVKHFEQTLKDLGIDFIESVGKAFDPTVHEAVGQSSKSETEDNVITEEFQRGTKLHGRVIRAAKVIVNKLSN